MQRKTCMAALLLITAIGAILSGGCGKSNPNTLVENTSEAAQVHITEPVTEPQTEKILKLKDIQVSIMKTNRRGSVEFQITSENSEKAGDIPYQSTSDTFYIKGQNSEEIYADASEAAVLTNGKWQEIENEGSIWDLVYLPECELLETVEINGRLCHHISVETEAAMAPISGICYTQGYEEVMTGVQRFDFYVNTSSYEIVRVDYMTPFLADYESKSVTGEIMGTMTVDGTEGIEIKKPDFDSGVQQPAIYHPGDIVQSQNLYRNKHFGIQIPGNEMFTYDMQRTQELAANYEQMGSSYRQEAYAEGSGVIVNISSIHAQGLTETEILEKYLTDSGAQEITASTNLTVAATTFLTYTANINETTTKSYCAVNMDEALIITLYFQDSHATETFESMLYGIEEDPFWTEATWMLEEKYQIKTPKGYAIDQKESGALYVCMKSSQDQINVFAIENGNLEQEIEAETGNVGTTMRETAVMENINLIDGTALTYMTVHNTEPSYDYYTYVGLFTKGTATLKLYAVGTDPNADYRAVFTEIANGTSVADTTASEVTTETMAETQPY